MKQVVLVTGSSSGIGRACCERLAERGWRVYGGSRTRLTPDTWTQLFLDVTDDASTTSAINEVVAREGRVDALVHSAGMCVAGAVEDLTIEEAQRQFNTNYFGSIAAIRGVLPHMRAAGRGRIIVIGSIAGCIALPFLSHYSASKFALDGMVEALALEVAPFGIEVGILHPGDIRTAIADNQTLGKNTGASSAYHEAFEVVLRIVDEAVANARSPDVVAAAVERMLSRRRLPLRRLCGTAIERAGVGLKAGLPRKWFAQVIRKAYGL